MLILASLITSGVFGIDTRQTLAYQIFALLLALLLISILSVFTFRGNFRIQRSLPDFGTVGQVLQYVFVIKNESSSLQKDLLLIDELVSIFPDYDEFIHSKDIKDSQRNIFDRLIGYPRLVGLIQKKRGGSIKPVELNSIAGMDSVEKKAQLIPVRRGYIHFTRSKIARPDPFGLFRAFKKYTNNDTLLILPKTYKVPSVQLSGKRKYQHGGMHAARSVGDSEEFFSLRDYRPGDPLREIHWRSYAKKGEPVVKEHQDEYFVRQGLILDTFLQQKPELIFEEAVSVAASFAVSIREQDALLDLIFVGTRAYRFTAGRGLAAVENMLEVLACVDICTEQPFDNLQKLVLSHSAETSGFICILLDWDEQRKQLLRQLRSMKIPVLLIIISQKSVIEKSVTDPMLDQPENFWVLQANNIQQSIDKLIV